jgi:holo-[acyl-carrier protein] synthase
LASLLVSNCIPDDPNENDEQDDVMIGCGVDLVFIPRMEQTCQRFGERFLSRVFTAEERRYCEHQRLPYSHFSGRFAAKEALIKAMGGFKITRWTEIEILRGTEGAPKMILHGQTAAVLSDRGVEKILLSISHDRDYCVAVVCLGGSGL